MLGLIKKDLLMIKQNLKTLILMVVVFIGISMVNESDMTFIIPFMAVMISISTFSYDSFNKWDAYAVTSPNGRKNAVRAKYIATIAFVLVCFAISFISLFVMKRCGGNIDLDSAIASLIGCLVAVAVVMGIMFPIIYKFGVENGRIALFILTFAVTGLATLVLRNVQINISGNVIDFFNNYYKVLIPLVSLLAIFISYLISEIVYSKKEF